MRRMPVLSVYAICSSLIWLPVALFQGIHETGIGRAYVSVARTILIPMYIVMHAFSLLLTTFLEPGVLTAVSTWLLAILTFVAFDLLRLRAKA